MTLALTLCMFIVKIIIQSNNQIQIMNQNHYTWNGVLEFLHVHSHPKQKHNEEQSEKQSLWFLEKKQLQDQIKQLQARVTSLEAINSDLLNRNRMLEYCLRNLKGKKKQQIQEEIPKLPQRRPKPNKDKITKVLYSLGVKNLLENIQKDIHERVPSARVNVEPQKVQNNHKELQEVKSSNYKEVGMLEGHQDGVRDLCFLDKNKLMVSVSQDCTMKVWSMKNPLNSTCLGTIREHSGPIFTVIEGDGFVLTGGMEGIIRCWNFENVQEKKDVGKKNLIGSWTNSEEDRLEPIWQLIYSPQNKLVFSTSSQISIKSYKVDVSQGVNATFKKSYSYGDHSMVKEEEDIPTAICLHHDKLVAGYVSSHSLVHFDIESGRVASEMTFDAQGQISTNKLTTHPSILLGAFEDKMVRIFDKNKMTYCFKAHDDSVMSIALVANMNEFFTCGHDGLVKLWDLRKFESISTFKAHDKKYDEAVHCLATSSHSIGGSGGADSIIKIYSV